MERTHRIQQIYGYLVCIIAIITMLIAGSSIIGSVFDLTRPDLAGYGHYDADPTTKNFDVYKRTRLKEVAELRSKGITDAPVPTDSELQKDYALIEKAKADSTAEEHARNKWRSIKSLTTHSLLLIFAIGLFIIHWRWLRRLPRSE